MKRIHLLNPELANQIAAGEVIERPASVVKELLENSLDANSTDIKIVIENGGIDRICINDNGDGIHPDDLAIALTRHGTSKISSFDELMQIESLGFRGEALASICSVSQLTLTSKHKDFNDAKSITAAGIELTPILSPSSHPQGTTIEIKNLFFNTPARRKFLKSLKTEFDHIEAIVAKMALSHPHVRFELYHHDKRVFLLMPAENKQQHLTRISKIFDNNFAEHAFDFHIERNGLVLHGFMSDANYGLNHNRHQAIFLNHRIIRDKIILHAIKQVYARFLPSDKHPAFVLHLEMNPALYDVNVHPTKHEVRFHESRLVHDFVVHALMQCLNSENTEQENVTQENFSQNNDTEATEQNNTTERFTYSGNFSAPKIASGTFSSYQSFYQHDSNQHEEHLFGKPLALLHHEILICQNDTELSFVYFNKLQKIILLQELKNALNHNELNIKPLLFPTQIALNEIEISAYKKLEAYFKNLGFEVDWLSESHIVIRSRPMLFASLDLNATFIALLNKINSFQENDQVNFFCQYIQFDKAKISIAFATDFLSQHQETIKKLNTKLFIYPLTKQQMVSWFES